MMRATYRKTKLQGMTCYMPVIEHTDTAEGYTHTWRETVYGDPLVFAEDARKYAQLEINDRYSMSKGV